MKAFAMTAEKVTRELRREIKTQVRFCGGTRVLQVWMCVETYSFFFIAISYTPLCMRTKYMDMSK